MNKNEKFVITINRELGSGGRTVGRKLAELLGVEYYDKALIDALKDKYHLTVEEIEKLKGQKQGWWADFKRMMLNGPGLSGNYYLPKKGDEPELLTRHHPNHLSILIQASMPFRVERVMRKQNMTEAEARKTIERVDKMRENYVKEYTNSSRYDTRNYDLVISADGKTEDEIVEVIMKYIG